MCILFLIFVVQRAKIKSMKKINLVLIPGLLSDKTVWEYQTGHLSDIANIIIPDLSGASTFSEMVDRIMKEAPEHFMLAGHSMGGRLVFEIIQRFPGRAAKLCFLATSAMSDSEEKKTLRKSIIKAAQKERYEEVITQLANLLTYNTDVKNDVIKMFLKNKDSLIKQEKAMLIQKNYVDLLKNIKQPTLVMVGKQDKHFFQSSIAIAKGIKHAKLKIIDHCGHMLTMEKPEKVSLLMREWIKS